MQYEYESFYFVPIGSFYTLIAQYTFLHRFSHLRGSPETLLKSELILHRSFHQDSTAEPGTLTQYDVPERITDQQPICIRFSIRIHNCHRTIVSSQPSLDRPPTTRPPPEIGPDKIRTNSRPKTTPYIHVYTYVYAVQKSFIHLCTKGRCEARGQASDSTSKPAPPTTATTESQTDRDPETRSPPLWTRGVQPRHTPSRSTPFVHSIFPLIRTSTRTTRITAAGEEGVGLDAERARIYQKRKSILSLRRLL